MKGIHLLTMAVAFSGTLSACGDDDSSGPATSFSAALNGANEVPPVPTTATGTATFSVSGGQITYTVNVTDLQNPVVAHIHIAPTGQNGPVRLNLCGTGAPQPACATGTGTFVLATGTNGTTVGAPAITFDSLLSAMRTGGAYVNAHTDDGVGQPNTGPGDMASGEIRGQIVAD
jgi:CHRD domain